MPHVAAEAATPYDSFLTGALTGKKKQQKQIPQSPRRLRDNTVSIVQASCFLASGEEARVLFRHGSWFAYEAQVGLNVLDAAHADERGEDLRR
jgi:hypothetical protein